MLVNYFGSIEKALNDIKEKEHKAITLAAEKIADSIANGSIVHVFGCGHSHMMAEEVFYRAGGLVPVHPILVEDLMLHKGGTRSSMFERTNGFAASFMNDQDIQNGDVMIVVSTSGRNPVPVDAALYGKKKGAFVIGLTSRQASLGQPSRHEDGLYLYDAVDLVLDNHVEPGDAVMRHEESQLTFGSTSTVVGMTIMNTVFVEAIQVMIERGFEPPVFKSGNVDGSDEANETLIQRYKDRIPMLGKTAPHS
ncbi:SIS domain-containing protein [Pseudalkalibacillus hwajinpoensis]|uniref:SIS domain-containing protein n=1 Tax=Guptibacillus hwajinpoensis TaxID=208199 RepID=UPI00325A8E63